MSGYILCTAPRSGSTLLCHMLTMTGIAGRPESLFNGNDLVRWGERVGVMPLADQTDFARCIFEAADGRGRNGRGMFGLRVQQHSLPFLSAVLEDVFPALTGDLARLRSAFGPLHCIHLTRRDKLRQAASWVRAQQTGLWHRAADGSELERLAPPSAPWFDRDALARAVAMFETQDKDWAAWFDANGCIPLPIAYEDLAADPRATLHKVLDFLELDPACAQHVTIPTRQLADTVTEDWVARMDAPHDPDGYQSTSPKASR